MTSDPCVVNGKRYSLWPQFVERKAEWIGGTLEDVTDGSFATKIKDIVFEPNGEASAFFGVRGEGFDCECDVSHLAVDPDTGGDGWIGFVGFGGLRFRIKKP